MTVTATNLPVLPLPHPLILLPSSRISLPLSSSLGEALLLLIDQSDSLPVIAAVPIVSKRIPNAVSTQPDSPPSTPETLHDWGVAARVLRLIKSPVANPSQPYLVSLHGLTRIRVTPAPATLGSIVEHPVEFAAPEEIPLKGDVDNFKAAALRLLDRLAKDATQQKRRDGWLKIAVMLEDISDQRAPWMADVLVATINTGYEDRLVYLSAHETKSRLEAASSIFLKQANIAEVSTKISNAVDESLSKQQKEFFLRQQLAAIQRELQALNRVSATSPSSPVGGPGFGGNGVSDLGDDEQAEADDLADLKRKIEAMEQGSEERKMGVREWRRLKRIPQGSVENGVIRSYLEWLCSLPWPNTTQPSSAPTPVSTQAFLAGARSQLDADHFGLDKIKRRLIEYLAVVRLKELNAAREVTISEKAKDSEKTAKMKLIKEGKNINAGEEGKEVAMIKNDRVGEGQRSPKRDGKKGVKGPILLFVGPPGTGKTSLGQSIAKALDRPFQRISLGGVRDEAEIRGHRRTYVASGPGLIVQALRKAGRSDPILLLDEIDKVGQSNFHGDPSAALLEVLDPEQNHTFNDHYINVPIDLSQVLFICTANTTDTISAPLLDRCEVIQLSGYTYDEKMHIARRFLLPKQLQANGLEPSHLTITDPALLHIATQYTREAGVRGLERAIGGVVRYKAVEWAEYADSENKEKKEYNSVVQESELEKILGISRWEGEEREREERRGVVYGLVVSGQGEGGILPVESIAVPGNGNLKLTGSLGEVIKESGELALSWVKTHAYDLCITNTPSQDPLKVPHAIDIHLHLPAGAQKKDGPSAGIAMTCAFVSLLTGARVPSNIAMTGEITLRGRVTPVGGIKEKVLGAHRAQVTKVILPWANRKDVEHEVAAEIRNDMEFAFVRTVTEALEAAFGKDKLVWRTNSLLIESRL